MKNKKILAIFGLILIVTMFTSCNIVFMNIAHANESVSIEKNCSQFLFNKEQPVSNKVNQYICYRQYAVAYSYEYKSPIYTVEYLNANHIGNDPRSTFQIDTSIPEQYRAYARDYIGATCGDRDCDKGHLTPDKDFSACTLCSYESFYMTNVVPQNASNNRGAWKSIETLFRRYVLKHSNGLFIISGVVFDEPIKYIGNKVAVPSYMYKIAINPSNGKTIAFMLPNNSVSSARSWITNVEEIEKRANIKFSSTLDKTSKAKLEDW